MSNLPSTADAVLAALQSYDLKFQPNGEWRCNSPLRPGSNSHGFSVKINGPEHGTFIDRVSGESGSLYTLATKLGITLPKTSTATTKRAYADLLDYAAAHYVPSQAFTAAGCYETDAYDSKGRLRSAVAIPTQTGIRYRFLDGDKPPFHSPSGYKRCWYRLDEAIILAKATNAPIVICNGEPSAIAAQHYNLPAACVTGSGEKSLPAHLLAELQAKWSGMIVVCLDCDNAGRTAAPAIVKQLLDAGFTASSVDMQGAEAFDLADWCGLHQSDALTDLLALQAPSAQPTGKEEFHATDLGNARRLVAQYGAELRFVKQWGWLVWDGRRWRLDDAGDIDRRAYRTALNIYQEAANEPDFNRRQELSRHARSTESVNRITAMISLAESQIEVRSAPGDFDANEWLLSCANGTLDLRTGTLKPHDPADMLTKAINVVYDQQANAPRWLAFLNRIFDGKASLIAYVQRMVGYSLTGITDAQCMFIAHGTGANGKSVLINVMRALLGDYARNADPSTFLAQKQEHVRSDLARLAGVRFVSTIELDEGKHLSEALIKQMTGSDPMTAAFKHQNEFDFQPRFKLLMATNHRPVIRGTDYAIWRRIKLIPFTVTIPERERDPWLIDKLKAELPGILAWAVQGCLDWQRNGMQEPVEVNVATNNYKSEMDVIGQFIDEDCLIAPQARVACGDLYSAYAKWADDGGERPINQRRFGSQMTERGFERVRGTGGTRYYEGIGLMTTRYEPQIDNQNLSQDKGSDTSDTSDATSGESLHEKNNSEIHRNLSHLRHLCHSPFPEQYIGPATWANKDQDSPVQVIGYWPDELSPDGKRYARILGSKTGVPVDELSIREPDIDNPLDRVDWIYVQKLLAIGDEKSLKGIQRHCTIKRVSYDEVLTELQD